MEADDVEGAYQEFATLLRSGEFTSPVDGWSAENIGAHVSLNNDEIASVAEAVGRGEFPAYDNSSGVDEDNLGEFTVRVGGRDGVALAIENSARRLAQSLRQLQGDAARVEVPVHIVDNGTVVVDRPLAIGDLIIGNVTFHLASHLEQLRELSHDE